MKNATKVAALALLITLVSACGGKDPLSGHVYQDETGMSAIAFHGRGKATMDIMGLSAEARYRIDGESVVLEGPQGSMRYHIVNDGSAIADQLFGMRMNRMAR